MLASQKSRAIGCQSITREYQQKSDEFFIDKGWFNNPEEVKRYALAVGLQPAEQAIVNILSARLAGMDMLDVGVGGGRTTGYFAPRVHQYIGIDYAPAMVQACQQRYPQFSFVNGDASCLTMFEDSMFDLVLFSYNGIDYMSKSNRDATLEELRRVLRPGGYLAFSSHNTGFLPILAKSFRVRPFGRPRRIAASVKRWLQFLLSNRTVHMSRNLLCATVYEGQLKFKAPTYYIRPACQIEALEAKKMNLVAAFACNSTEPFSIAELNASEAPWIYYLCQKSVVTF
jgi:SAM-dependent methyltransferase